MARLAVSSVSAAVEFRQPLLIGMFRFAALQAVILNKALSLVVVATALPFRAATVPFSAVGANWPIIVNPQIALRALGRRIAIPGPGG